METGSCRTFSAARTGTSVPFLSKSGKEKRMKGGGQICPGTAIAFADSVFPKNSECFKVPAQPGGFDSMIRGCLSPRFHLNTFAVTPNEPKLSGGPVAHSPTRLPASAHLTLLVAQWSRVCDATLDHLLLLCSGVLGQRRRLRDVVELRDREIRDVKSSRSILDEA